MPAAVDDVRDVVDRDRGLGDVGGEHHLLGVRVSPRLWVGVGMFELGLGLALGLVAGSSEQYLG